MPHIVQEEATRWLQCTAFAGERVHPLAGLTLVVMHIIQHRLTLNCTHTTDVRISYTQDEHFPKQQFVYKPGFETRFFPTSVVAV
jgi:hypothetical protein